MCVLERGHVGPHKSRCGREWENNAFQIHDRETKLMRLPTGAAAKANEEIVRLRARCKELAGVLDWVSQYVKIEDDAQAQNFWDGHLFTARAIEKEQNR
jgi:hypothetical protein